MSFCGYLKVSTAVDILMGPFIDDTDGKTAETVLTIDVELSKNGQALTDSESAAPTHDAAGTVDGYYNCILGTTDTATLGILTVVAHAAGFLPVRHDYQVVTANWFDSMCSTDILQADVTQIGGVAQSATDLKDFADTGYDPTNHVAQSDMTYIHGSALTETAGQLAAAFVKLFDVATPLLVASDVMRGTDSAALASVLGALNNVAADGDSTDADTIMQYIKQLINILIGTAGVAAFPAEAAPANAVSLAEVIRAIHVDTSTTLDTLVKDIPTTAEIALRTLLAADYVVVGDTIAGVTAVTNDVGITQAGADKVWGTAARVLTAGTNLNDISVANITGAEVDNDGTAISLAGALKLILSVLAGKSSGGGTATIVFRDIADSKNRISATVDSDGNRDAVGTRDAS